MRVGTAEGHHVDLLTGDTADHVGSGDEDAGLGRHDDDVGQRRTVRRTAGCEAEDDRNLWDAAGRADHGLEDQSDGVQGLDALGETRATRVPETHDRGVFLEGGVDRRHDVLAAFDAHGAAHDGGIGAVCDGADTVDVAGRGQHTGLVTRMQGDDSPGVEQLLQARKGIARIDRRIGLRRGCQDCHRVLLVAGPGGLSMGGDPFEKGSPPAS